MINDKEREDIKEQIFLTSVKNKTEVVHLIKELLASLEMTETVEMLNKELQMNDVQETFQEKLQKLEAAEYRSESEKRSIIGQFLQKQYISRIERQNIHSALDLLSNKMDAYCNNREKLSTYLINLPKKEPKLVKLLQPYLMKEQCPPLPKYKVMKAIFEEDQVWFVKSNGKYIIAIDKKSNGKVFVEDPSKGFKIQAQRRALHNKFTTCVAWKNERQFGTTSEDATAKIWSAQKLECLKTIDGHTNRISSISFTNSHIITGGFDKLIISNLDGTRKQEVASHKIFDMCATKDNKILMTVTANKHHINFISLQNFCEIDKIKENQQIMSMCLSNNNKYLFVNVSQIRPQIHVYTVDKREAIQKWTGNRIHIAVGHVQNNFVLRMQNGGPYGQFVAIGSQNGEILIFHISHEYPIHRIQACKDRPINTVTWLDENRLVECNDDRSVQIWSTKDDDLVKIMPQPSEHFRREPTREELIRLMMMPNAIFNDDESDQEEI